MFSRIFLIQIYKLFEWMNECWKRKPTSYWSKKGFFPRFRAFEKIKIIIWTRFSFCIYIYILFFSEYQNSPSLQNVSRTSMREKTSKSQSRGKENDEKILQKTQKRILFWPIFVGKITKKSYLMDAKNFGFTYHSNVAEIFFLGIQRN